MPHLVAILGLKLAILVRLAVLVPQLLAILVALRVGPHTCLLLAPTMPTPGTGYHHHHQHQRIHRR
jgi:hypothetical protein